MLQSSPLRYSSATTAVEAPFRVRKGPICSPSPLSHSSGTVSPRAASQTARPELKACGFRSLRPTL
ncbi:hypothetical protein COLO4_04847 [Corchorus olitorius]|uniref:Uncharacterized protein n=1 Tax=Corchorus olitorius TaxID=93759 RepID=A0A1R3KSK8_9ROSI|nr:hypothetical protein COLO4_04847 [Corchorus olitorius]